MYEDPVVAEIHRIREEYSALFDHDLKRIAQDLLRKQAEYERAGCQIVQPPIRANAKAAVTTAN